MTFVCPASLSLSLCLTSCNRSRVKRLKLGASSYQSPIARWIPLHAFELRRIAKNAKDRPSRKVSSLPVDPVSSSIPVQTLRQIFSNTLCNIGNSSAKHLTLSHKHTHTDTNKHKHCNDENNCCQLTRKKILRQIKYTEILFAVTASRGLMFFFCILYLCQICTLLVNHENCLVEECHEEKIKQRYKIVCFLLLKIVGTEQTLGSFGDFAITARTSAARQCGKRACNTVRVDTEILHVVGAATAVATIPTVLAYSFSYNFTTSKVVNLSTTLIAVVKTSPRCNYLLLSLIYTRAPTFTRVRLWI